MVALPLGSCDTMPLVSGAPPGAVWAKTLVVPGVVENDSGYVEAAGGLFLGLGRVGMGEWAVLSRTKT